jgi:hypothetical protein
VLVAIVAVSALLRMRRRHTVADRAAALVDQRTPAEVRAAINEMLIDRNLNPDELLREPSERGDSYRAFRSIADAIETDRIDEGNGRALLAERVGDLLEVIR